MTGIALLFVAAALILLGLATAISPGWWRDVPRSKRARLRHEAMQRHPAGKKIGRRP